VTQNVLALDDCKETDCVGTSCQGAEVNDCQITCGFCDRSCLCAKVEGVDALNGFYEWDANERGWKNGDLTLRYYYNTISSIGWIHVFWRPDDQELSWYLEVESDVDMTRPKGGNFSNGDNSANIVIDCEECSLNPTTSPSETPTTPKPTPTPYFGEWLQKSFFIWIDPFTLDKVWDTEDATLLALNLGEGDISDYELIDWAPLWYWQDKSTCESWVACQQNFSISNGTWGFRYQLNIIPSALPHFNYKVLGEGRDNFELAIAQNLESAGFPNRTVSLESFVAPSGLSKEKSTTIIIVTLIGLCLFAGFCVYYFRCVRSKKELQFHQIEVGESSNRINWTRDGETSDEDINYRSNSGQRISLADRKREEIRKNIVGTWVMGSRSWKISNDGMGDYRITQVGGSANTKTATITDEGRFSIENGNYTAFFSNNK